MPITVAISAAIGFGLGYYGLGIAAATALASGFATAALYGGLAAVSYLLRPKPPAFGDGQRGQSQSLIVSKQVPKRWIHGRARTSGWLCWARVGGPGNKPDTKDSIVATQGGRYLHLVYVLSEAPITQLESIWINGIPQKHALARRAPPNYVLNAAGDSYDEAIYSHYATHAEAPDNAIWVPAGANELYGPSTGKSDRGVPRWQVWTQFDGSGIHADLTPSAEPPINFNWSSDHKALGRAYVYVVLFQPDIDRSAEPVWRGPPRIEFLVRGFKHQWPEADDGTLSAVRWSENAAVFTYWLLRHRVGWPASLIDVPHFRAAVQDCSIGMHDGAPFGYPEPYVKYGFNGIVDSAMRNSDLLNEAMLAMSGHGSMYDGRFHMYSGQNYPAMRTLNESDIISIDQMRVSPPLAQRGNAAAMTLRQSVAGLGESAHYAPHVCKDYVNSDWAAQDGATLLLDLGERPFETHPIRAWRMMVVALRRLRAHINPDAPAAFQLTLTIRPGDTFENIAILPGDRLYVTLDEFGLTNQLVECTECRINTDLSVQLILQAAAVDLFSNLDPDPNAPPVFPPPPPPPVESESVSGFTASGVIGGKWSDRIRFTIFATLRWNPSPKYRTRIGGDAAKTLAVGVAITDLTLGNVDGYSTAFSYTLTAQYINSDGDGIGNVQRATISGTAPTSSTDPGKIDGEDPPTPTTIRVLGFSASVALGAVTIEAPDSYPATGTFNFAASADYRIQITGSGANLIAAIGATTISGALNALSIGGGPHTLTFTAQYIDASNTPIGEPNTIRVSVPVPPAPLTVVALPPTPGSTPPLLSARITWTSHPTYRTRITGTQQNLIFAAGVGLANHVPIAYTTTVSTFEFTISAQYIDAQGTGVGATVSTVLRL